MSEKYVLQIKIYKTNGNFLRHEENIVQDILGKKKKSRGEGLDGGYGNKKQRTKGNNFTRKVI